MSSAPTMATFETDPRRWAEQQGAVTEVEGHRIAGILVHSTVTVDPQNRTPLGLIDQQRWSRPVTQAGSKPKRQKITGQHKRRAYQEKESIKWEQANERMRGRMESSAAVITACDREADIYDYLVYLFSQGHCFVIRAAQDRRLATREVFYNRRRMHSLLDYMTPDEFESCTSKRGVA